MVEKKTAEKNLAPQFRFSSAELQLLKTNFADNEAPLIALRKFLWQRELNAGESKMLKNLKTEPLLKLIRKMLVPSLDGNMPLHQEIDVFMHMRTELKEMESSEALLRIKYIDLANRYLDQQLSLLEEKEVKEELSFAMLNKFISDDAVKTYITLQARNEIVFRIEQELFRMKMLAGSKEETPEETLERLLQNSNK